jgi:hypothetical protein
MDMVAQWWTNPRGRFGRTIRGTVVVFSREKELALRNAVRYEYRRQFQRLLDTLLHSCSIRLARVAEDADQLDVGFGFNDILSPRYIRESNILNYLGAFENSQGCSDDPLCVALGLPFAYCISTRTRVIVMHSGNDGASGTYESVRASKKGGHDSQSDHDAIGPFSTDRRLQRKLVYTACLLLALLLIQRGSMQDDASFSIWTIVQQHEPSVRIFRALWETVLLLLCTAASITVWCRYLTVTTTARLLFAPVQATTPVTWTATAVEPDDANDNDSVATFADVHETDVFQGQNATEESSTTTDLIEDYQDATEVAYHGTTFESNRTTDYQDWIPTSLSIVNGALDLLVWILVALVLYTVTASEAIHWYQPALVSSIDSMYNASDNERQGGGHWMRWWARLAAPTFPLLLFTGAAIKAVYPWRLRRPLYAIVSYTLWAPGYEVTFRDGMIVRFCILRERRFWARCRMVGPVAHSFGRHLSLSFYRVMCSRPWCVPCRILPLHSFTWPLV